jgi:hypothetical protein
MSSASVVSRWPVARIPAEKGQVPSVFGDEVVGVASRPVPADRLWGVSEPTQVPARIQSLRNADGYALITASVEMASASLEALCQGIVETAHAFRRLDIKNANLQLVRLAKGLRLVTALADMAAAASGLDLDALSSTGQLDSMGEALDELSALQFAHDWNGVADTLENEVAPSLAGWREVFADILVSADSRFRQPRVS